MKIINTKKLKLTVRWDRRGWWDELREVKARNYYIFCIQYVTGPDAAMLAFTLLPIAVNIGWPRREKESEGGAS